MFQVWEFYGTGDPFFGGNADDRILRADDGQFGSKGPVAQFKTYHEAQLAAERAGNRRRGSLVSILEI
jgi:hypothetical protein